MVRLNLFKYWMKKQFHYMFKLAEYNLEMPVWKYNDKCVFIELMITSC